jgi:hypothetical protein
MHDPFGFFCGRLTFRRHVFEALEIREFPAEYVPVEIERLFTIAVKVEIRVDGRHFSSFVFEIFFGRGCFGSAP